MKKLTSSLIKKAYKNHLAWFSKTPIEYSETLSSHLHVPFFFKCDFMQPMGSYSLRGAYFLLSTLKDPEKKQTIGISIPYQEALSFAYAAKILNLACILYTQTPQEMESMPLFLRHFAEVRLFDLPLTEIAKKAKKECKEKGFLFFDADKDARMQAGNGGSLALEIFDQMPQIKNVLMPLKDLSLCQGLSYFFREKFPGCCLIGVTGQSSRIDSSFVTHQVFVSEEEKEKAQLFMIKEHHLLISVDAAAVVSACFSKSMPKLEGVTTAVLTDRNFSYTKLLKLLN